MRKLLKMADSSSLVGFLSDSSTLLALGAVAVGTAWYLSSSTTPCEPPVPLDNQSLADSEDHIRTSHFSKDGLTTTIYDDATTLYEAFQRGKRVSNNGRCLGRRSSPTGPYEWITYGEVEERAIALGAGLSALGVEPGQNSFIGIYSSNSIEWVIAEQSCNCYSRVTVPLYDTLGPETVSYTINLTCTSVVVCHDNKVEILFKQAKSAPTLKIIVKMGLEVTEEERQLSNESGVAIYTYKEVEKLGRASPVDLVLPKPEYISTICFTSGTTGNPKGVILTHGNIISNVAAIILQTESVVVATKDDCYISYLPLAHMMERTCHAMLYMSGCHVGFFQGDVKLLVSDIQELKPTIFVSVPRLLNRIYDKVIAGVSKSPIKKWLFDKALASKESEINRGIVRRNSIWDYLVFSRIQNSLGGRVRMVVTGSAPLSSKVMTFLRCSMGCHIFEGYGQTECTAGATFSTPGDTSVGHVGVPLSCCQIKLVDVKDMNYFASNGDGEVCIRGPSVFKGYLKEPEKTADALDEDNWLHTGDIGKWLPNGTLKIIDRKKNIFKLSQGEYVAPEKVENIYMRSPFVAQVYHHGDSLKSCCIAIIVPDEEVLIEWAKEKEIKGNFKELCFNEIVMKMILDSITTKGKEAGLHSFEQAKAITLHDELFSVDNGFLTPTFKLKRPIVRDAFKDVLDKMYNKFS